MPDIGKDGHALKAIRKFRRFGLTTPIPALPLAFGLEGKQAHLLGGFLRHGSPSPVGGRVPMIGARLAARKSFVCLRRLLPRFL